MIRRALVAFLVTGIGPALIGPALADGRILRVGPGEVHSTPGEAAAAARPGDRVLIEPGVYRECAVWRAPDVTVEAAGGPVVITGPVCGGKGLFVAAAPNLTVIGLTFEGARAEAGNGAGIRAEGGDLTVRGSTFRDNENGILTAANLPSARLLIEDSTFLRNGALREGRECAHGIYAGNLALVAVRGSRFAGTQACHHVKSRAQRTEVERSVIEDGPDGTSSYLVDVPNGGDLLLLRNRLRKGPQTGNPTAAIVIGAEGVRRPTASLRIEANDFQSLLAGPTTFVVNRTGTPATLVGNRILGSVAPLVGPGSVR
ncbi:hypothetical protein ACE7GA_14705 [Roseomonas sp. CCTCC AB2023176]|uniref:hypothetical protein n=1 Tax=Roseomonas sp. CCTCC AB2023176 TaxID=3342640 RepID=UPI0035E39B21